MIEASYRKAVRVPLTAGEVTVVRRGAGRPVLLLHGIPLSLLTWRHTVGALAAEFEVIAVDLLGYGESDKPGDADYSLDGQAALLTELADALRLATVDVVGSSYGGAVALTLAASAPELVRRLVLVNPVCYPGGPHDLERLSRVRLVAALGGPALRAPALGRRLLAGRLGRSYARPEQATPELVDAYHAQLLRRSGERAYLASLRALRQGELVRRLPRVTHPTLVVWGELDHVLPSGDGRRIVRDLPDARLAIVPQVGHFPHEEAPGRVNALIASFLRASPQDRSQPAAASKGPV